MEKISVSDVESARGLRVLPPSIFYLSIAVQAPLALWHWPLSPSLAQIVLGGCLFVAGTAVAVWAEQLFKRLGVEVKPFGPVPKLVEGGPYRVSRNPMYVGMVMATSGVAIGTGILLNLWSACLLAYILHVWFILPEERFLESELGGAFATYRARTPRWLGLPVRYR